MQARAEQEQARSRFEQALQKAAGKGDQNTLSRRSSGDRLAAGTSRGNEKKPVPATDSLRKGPDRSGGQQQWSVTANSSMPPEKNSVEISKSPEAKILQSRETATQHTLLNGLRPADSIKFVLSDEDDRTTDVGLESLACPSPLGLQEPQSGSPEISPMARAGNFSQFETIESMLSHLSLMTARYGPRDWTFEIQNEHTSIVSVSLAPAANGGWNVAVTAKQEDQTGAQRYLEELRVMLQDTDVASLRVSDASTMPTQSKEQTKS